MELDLSHASYEECQQRVLYGCLVNPSVRRECRPVLGSDGAKWFESPLWKDVYSGLIERDRTENQYWDLEVIEWVQRTQEGESTREQVKQIRELFAGNFHSVTAVFWASRLVELGRKRLAREIGEQLITETADQDAVMRSLAQIRAGTDMPMSIADIIPTALAEHLNPTARISTGFRSLDDMVGGGIGAGHLFIIGARTGRGKTAACINLALNALRCHRRVLFYTLEMSAVQILDRLIRVNYGVFPTGTNYESSARRIASLPLKIVKANHCSVLDIESAIEAEKSIGLAPELVVVDYLQLLKPMAKTSNRQEQVADVSRDLKRLAQTTQTAIVSPSQLRRPSSEDEDATPGLHHLRESGAIEQDADFVMLLSSKDAVEHDSVILRAELAKNRHGRVGTLYFDFDLVSQRFTERGYDAE